MGERDKDTNGNLIDNIESTPSDSDDTNTDTDDDIDTLESQEDMDFWQDEESDEDDSPSNIVERQDEKNEEYEYSVLEPDEIVNYMNDRLESVRAVVGDNVPTTVLRVILNDMKWDVDQVLEYVYSEEGTKVLMEGAVEKDSEVMNGKKEENEELCELCYLEVAKECLTNVTMCSHSYCKECLVQYLTIQVEEQASDSIQCPGCSVFMSDSQVLSLLPQSKTRCQYLRLITNTFIQSSRVMRWCPGRDCGRAVRMVAGLGTVVCICKERFCFGCSQTEHNPAPCGMFKKWNVKYQEDGETSKWIDTNTKECPKCLQTIVKDGGCMHMTCRNCKQEFCWLCMKNHNNHSGRCSVFKESDVSTDRQSKGGVSIQRYMFYYYRYSSHKEALTLQDTIISRVRDRATSQDRDGHNIDMYVIEDALNTLGKCRRTLMNTYVLSNYLEKTHETEIFEMNQKDLEESTEKLGQYLEKSSKSGYDWETDELAVMVMSDLRDMERYCSQRRKVLLDHAMMFTD